MIIIGEKINGSIPSVAMPLPAATQILSSSEPSRRRKPARRLSTAVRPFPEAQEVETLRWMIDCIQSVTDLPISVDSPSTKVLSEAYKVLQQAGSVQLRLRRRA